MKMPSTARKKPVEATRVITLRCPNSVYERVVEASIEARKSINQWCVEKLRESTLPGRKTA
jgi:predicted HicB family RNase H-like nuclease